jgi:ABC-2 type transport system permease protein
MMFGKVLASCIAGLTQLIAVFGSALLFYNINKAALGNNMVIRSLFNIPVDLFVYMLVFYLLRRFYIFYGQFSLECMLEASRGQISPYKA